MKAFTFISGQIKGVKANYFKYLRRKGKAYQPRSKDKQTGRGFIRSRVSIDERPSVVEDKSRMGDWEIDLVIGKGHSGALVTIVERKTSFTVSMRVDDKSASAVTAAQLLYYNHLNMQCTQ